MTQNNAENKSGDEAVQAFIELRETVARLRAEDGCPWDRAQTHETLKPECVEEAAEVICGINILRETGSPDSLIEELGDLLPFTEGRIRCIIKRVHRAFSKDAYD